MCFMRFVSSFQIIIKRFNHVLVLAETSSSQSLNPITRNAVTAAKKIGGTISILVTGPKSAADSLTKTQGIQKILVSESATTPEQIAPLTLTLHGEIKFTHILAGATAFGRSVIPRIASLLNVSVASDVIAIKSPDTFTRPIYAGNALLTLTSLDPIKILTIRATNFAPDPLDGGTVAVEPAPEVTIDGPQVLGRDLAGESSERPDLVSAKIVVSGGRALKSKENFKLIYELAGKLGGAVGATRAAVDAGFVTNDLQIGQTGKIVAPNLYIAIGISGAIQHLAGMKESKIIVAINSDGDAPIFHVADFGLVEDLFKAVPELIQKL